MAIGNFVRKKLGEDANGHWQFCQEKAGKGRQWPLAILSGKNWERTPMAPKIAKIHPGIFPGVVFQHLLPPEGAPWE